MESSYQREVIKNALMKSPKKQRDNFETKRKNQIFPLSKNAKERTGSFNNICKSTGTVFHEWSLNINRTYKIKQKAQVILKNGGTFGKNLMKLSEC